ncbi:MAG: hypothetical protein ACR2NA_10675 [Solirubrobacterales bacterium]
MEVVAAIVVLVAAAAFVAWPLMRPATAETIQTVSDPRIAALEARKESKYREIRDAELDMAQGKVSEADHRRVDRELRAEAVAILKELEELEALGR